MFFILWPHPSSSAFLVRRRHQSERGEYTYSTLLRTIKLGNITRGGKKKPPCIRASFTYLTSLFFAPSLGEERAKKASHVSSPSSPPPPGESAGKQSVVVSDALILGRVSSCVCLSVYILEARSLVCGA